MFHFVKSSSLSPWSGTKAADERCPPNTFEGMLPRDCAAALLVSCSHPLALVPIPDVAGVSCVLPVLLESLRCGTASSPVGNSG